MSIDKKVDFMRVWRMKHTDMAQPAMLIYDYLNVAGERNKNEGTYLDMSDQINKVMTVAKELKYHSCYSYANKPLWRCPKQKQQLWCFSVDWRLF